MTPPESNLPGNGAEFPFLDSASRARYEILLQLLPPVLIPQLRHLLREAGNSDQAVLQLEMLLQRHPVKAIAAFESSSIALRSCIALFGASQWLGQTLLQHPDLLEVFARSNVPPRMEEDFREEFAKFQRQSRDTDLPVLLARFKRREYVRIFARELDGLVSLAEITEEISELSDALIEIALSHCENALRSRYHGWPQLQCGDGRVLAARFSVLSLGKLGGNELNYSSDIDLLYLCDDGADAVSADIPAREFFTRLAQELTSILSTINTDGQVFRVDLRLRPQGSSGEMVAGYGQALRYYRHVAQDWELQSLLKLRVTAGDRLLGRQFVSQVQELIYCKQLSLSAVETAARSLERIRRETDHRSCHELDVKNGAGGLREIEFVAQCLQRVHGGGEPWLRASGTLSALQKLHDKGHIGDNEFRQLCKSYELLRAIEHRLQCRQGIQTHRLPESVDEQSAIFRSLGPDCIRTVQELKHAMRTTSELCARVLRLRADTETGTLPAASVSLGAPGAEQLKRELAVRSPTIADTLHASVGDPTLRNVQRFLAAASTGKERTCGTLKNVKWLEQALPVFANSLMATNTLARNPEDIDALFGVTRPSRQSSIPDQLRIDSRRCILRTVGRSILENVPVWEILRMHSEEFDVILNRALDGIEVPEGFGIFALGRLGTRELDVVSDADLVFLRSPESDSEAAERCAHNVVSMLSSYTREGTVIAVDTRLRPHGTEGDLVSSTRQLVQYFETDAKAWETLAFSKLRWIAGARHLEDAAAVAVGSLQKRFAIQPTFASELRAMRKRIADSGGSEISFKTGPGGLYDLDFLVGLLEARAGLAAAGRQLPERLEALRTREFLSTEQVVSLMRSGVLFRRVDHAVRVVEGRSRRWLPENDVLLESVERIVGASSLDGALREEMVNVRSIFDFFFRN